MPGPLVSIVTPSRNQGEFIRATVESVLSQDYGNIEYLVIDNCSTDSTLGILREYASRVRVISEPDNGQSQGINKGFLRCAGEIVTWLNSDDLLLPRAVSRAVDALGSNPHYAAVYGEGYLMDRHGCNWRRFPVTEPFNLWRLTYLSDYILQQTTYFRRCALDRVGYLDESLHYAMDWDLLIRIGKQFEIGYIPEFMGCLREYPEAKSFAGGEIRIDEIRRVLSRHTGLRFPPGYIVYGLDEYRRIWNRRIRAITPPLLEFPSGIFQRALDLACRHVIGHEILKAQGWFPDRCAGRHLKLMAPASVRSMILTIDNWHDRVVVLDVLVNGSTRAPLELAPGERCYELHLPDSDGPAWIDLRAHGAVPRIGRDGSRRYFRLEQISFAGAPALPALEAAGR